MAKKLIALLQRHGDTEANEENVFRSRLDPPLNNKGIKQAEAAAKNIVKHYGKEIKKVVSSPMLRSLQTADIVAEELGLKAIQDRGLISWHLGFLSGRDKDVYQDILDYYVDNPKKAIPEGESLDDLETRLEEFCDEAFRGEFGVYVTHNSNLVTIENLITGTKTGRQESNEKSVEPGGTIGIYLEEDGKTYSAEVLFGVENGAEYTS
jgi:broad specificity phosphatase PhoE